MIKWKPFPSHWPFVQGIHQSPVNSPHKGRWLRALKLSLICTWIDGWVNNRKASDLRCRRPHYDVTVMMVKFLKQDKSEGFEGCDRPIVRKHPIWVKIGDVLSRVTLKFDGWPWKTIGHLFFAVSSFVQHFIAIVEFKLELQSGNAQFESNSTICRAMWPWNLMVDLEKQ